MIGTSLNQYRITASIGAGGMGEVFRGRDTRLNRDVAVKVLPKEFAADADRLRRFEQEAKTLAALSHPNILTIHEAGVHEGAPFLVSELLEGKTLREEMNVGALPVRKATDYARQIAQGLAAAHGKGVIHRDLKPENVFVTQDGQVKILDFGLAKLRNSSPGLRSPSPLEGERDGVRGEAATISIDADTILNSTEPGKVMGTPAYMAPEQARGEPADYRADIFAFGSVLYEMLSGTRAFRRGTPVETLNAVLKEEPPDLTASKRDLHPALARIVHRCLEKQPERRFQSSSDLAFALESLAGSSGGAGGAALFAPARPAKKFQASTAIALGAVAVLILWKPWDSSSRRHATENADYPTSHLHLPIAVPPGDMLIPDYGPLVAISPDGTRVAFTPEDTNGVRHLWVQSLSEPKATVLPNTEDAIDPLFSLDGKWVAYFVYNVGTYVVSIEGGAPRKIGRNPDGLGGCWGSNGAIYEVPGWTRGIWKLSSTRMFPPEQITRTDPQSERAHLWPNLSPDGRLLMYTIWNDGSFDTARTVVESLATRERSFIHVGASSAKFAANDLIVFAQGGALLAAPFDPAALKLRLPPRAVLSGVMMDPRDGGGQYDLSTGGALVYVPGASRILARRVVRVDREGKVEPWSEHISDSIHLALSHDNTRVALALANSGELDIHVIERGRQLPLRLSTGGDDYDPAWSADGLRVIWNSGRDGELQLYWRAADASDTEERLTSGPGYKRWCSFAPNGQAVAFTASSTDSAGSSEAKPGQTAVNDSDDIWVLPLVGDRVPYSLIATRANEQGPQFSPDGRLLAYRSDETGRSEIWVQAVKIDGPVVQAVGPSRQVSTAGGIEPRWSADSRELFFRESRGFFVVTNQSTAAFQPTPPRRMFEGEFAPSWDVERDGQHFVMLERAPDFPRLRAFHYVENWVEEVRRRLGAAGGER